MGSEPYNVSVIQEQITGSSLKVLHVLASVAGGISTLVIGPPASGKSLACDLAYELGQKEELCSHALKCHNLSIFAPVLQDFTKDDRVWMFCDEISHLGNSDELISKLVSAVGQLSYDGEFHRLMRDSFSLECGSLGFVLGVQPHIMKKLLNHRSYETMIRGKFHRFWDLPMEPRGKWIDKKEFVNHCLRRMKIFEPWNPQPSKELIWALTKQCGWRNYQFAKKYLRGLSYFIEEEYMDNFVFLLTKQLELEDTFVEKRSDQEKSHFRVKIFEYNVAYVLASDPNASLEEIAAYCGYSVGDVAKYISSNYALNEITSVFGCSKSYAKKINAKIEKMKDFVNEWQAKTEIWRGEK